MFKKKDTIMLCLYKVHTHIQTRSDPLPYFYIYFLIIADGGDDDDDQTPSKAPHPMSSSALMKLAEGGEDVVEDLELSDDD